MDPSLPIVDLPDLQRPDPDPRAGGSESRGLGGPPRPGGFRFASRRGGGRPRIDGGDPGPSDPGPRPEDSDGRAVGRAPDGGEYEFPRFCRLLASRLWAGNFPNWAEHQLGSKGRSRPRSRSGPTGCPRARQPGHAPPPPPQSGLDPPPRRDPPRRPAPIEYTCPIEYT